MFELTALEHSQTGVRLTPLGREVLVGAAQNNINRSEQHGGIGAQRATRKDDAGHTPVQRVQMLLAEHGGEISGANFMEFYRARWREVGFAHDKSKRLRARLAPLAAAGACALEFRTPRPGHPPSLWVVSTASGTPEAEPHDMAQRSMEVDGHGMDPRAASGTDEMSASASAAATVTRPRAVSTKLLDGSVISGYYPLCSFFQRTGHCKKGDQCLRAHGDVELECWRQQIAQRDNNNRADSPIIHEADIIVHHEPEPGQQDTHLSVTVCTDKVSRRVCLPSVSSASSVTTM